MFGEWVNVDLADGSNTSGVIIKSVLEGDSYKLKILFPGCLGCYEYVKGWMHSAREFLNPLSEKWKKLMVGDFSNCESFSNFDEMYKFLNDVNIVFEGGLYNILLNKEKYELSTDFVDLCDFLRVNGYQEWLDGLIVFDGVGGQLREVDGDFDYYNYYCVKFDENLILYDVGRSWYKYSIGGVLYRSSGSGEQHYGNFIESFEIKKNGLARCGYQI